jgi:hypothetical protein
MTEAPIAYRIPQALEVFPLGRTEFYKLLASGQIESFTVGRARFIPRQSLIDFMDRSLAQQSDKAVSR